MLNRQRQNMNASSHNLIECLTRDVELLDLSRIPAKTICQSLDLPPKPIRRL